MRLLQRIKLAFIIIFPLLPYTGTTQNTYSDGRESAECASCQEMIDEMPKEVLFGIQINPNGDVYFSMTDKKWFDKLFKNDSYGVAVDLIPKSRYDCSKDNSTDFKIPKGTAITGIYRKQLLAGNNKLVNRGIFVKVGKIPSSLAGKELEGNLIILNGTKICYYTNFVDIDRNVWELLPMGFYTDSLISEHRSTDNLQKDFFTYESKIKIEIPFARGSSTFESTYLRKYLDSINLSSSIIKKIEIRAYSSIEGPEAINKSLMAKRAESLITGLKKYQPSLKRVHIITAENWLDFYKDLKTTKFQNLTKRSKSEIKKQLTDANLLNEIEPILMKHRKVIAVLYVEGRGDHFLTNDSSILKDINQAIIHKEIRKAEVLLKELSNRIADNKLPVGALDKIEVPKTKECKPFLKERKI